MQFATKCIATCAMRWATPSGSEARDIEAVDASREQRALIDELQRRGRGNDFLWLLRLAPVAIDELRDILIVSGVVAFIFGVAVLVSLAFSGHLTL
jgi:hypothetical protein